MSQKSWVPASQPPAFDGYASRRVMVWLDDGSVATGHAYPRQGCEFFWVFVGEDEYPSARVTHWMDLPEPPTVG